MPQDPSAWTAATAVTASQLNTDLYTYQPGNNHYPNGLLFHSQPPMVMSNMTTSLNVASSAGGSSTDISSAGDWRSAIDNNVLFGAGADRMGQGADGHYEPTVAGSAGFLNGVAATPGGMYLAWVVTAIGSTTNAQGFGAQFFNGGSGAAHGGIQLTSASADNGSYAMDLTQVTEPDFLDAAAYVVDSSGGSYPTKVNATDYTGETCHFGCLWSAPDPANSPAVAGSLPVPTTGYTGASTITAAGLNGNGVRTPLEFLNNPPQVKALGSPTTSISNSATPTATAVPLTTAPNIDNWSGYNTGTSLYTVPVSGVYLVHVSVQYSANTTGKRLAGVKINGGTSYWGPAYQATGAGVCRPQLLRLLDLNAGDTIGAVTSQSSGGSLALSSSFTSRMIVRFMSAQAGSNGSVSWTPPDAGFRWQAGTPGSDLVDQFNTYLGNDLSFLIQRPYLMAYQSSAQTGLAQNVFSRVTMDTLGGRVNGTAGDNYGGWTSGASNKYAAVVPGWYLAVLNVVQAGPASTAQLIAGIGYYTAGAAAQGSSAQQWGQHAHTTLTSGYAVGAEAVGMFYLREGDYLQPYYRQQGGGATYNTSVGTTGQESSFGVVWISE